MESTSVTRFLFELASDERLGILTAISEKPLKHVQIARQLDMTNSETTRHLERLSSASLVARNSRGEYEPTNLARLLSLGFPFFRFLTMNHKYVLGHNLQSLPSEFVERLGALSEGTFTEGTYKVVDFQEQSLRAVERRIWVLTEQAFERAIEIIREKASRGADVRVIRPQEGFEDVVSGMKRNYPVRLVEKATIFLAVLDKIAGVCFPTLDGKVDMSAMLLLQDPRGYQWATDLFLHFWDQAQERS